MFLHTSFEILLQELAIVMTQPAFQNFVTIATGWVFARRRTVTGMLVAAGVVQLDRDLVRPAKVELR